MRHSRNLACRRKSRRPVSAWTRVTQVVPYQVSFLSTFALVQQLLIAKRDLRLEALLRQLDRCNVIVLDDIGYDQELDEGECVVVAFSSYRGATNYHRRPRCAAEILPNHWLFQNLLTTPIATATTPAGGGDCAPVPAAPTHPTHP
ncbi:MAG: ATP-binding protein [Verrucomicrobiota bacterium]